MSTEDLGLAHVDKKGGGVLFFKEFRVIMKGLDAGCIEFLRRGQKVKAPPESIRRWPKNAKLTKKQKELMAEVKQANLALKNAKKRKD